MITLGNTMKLGLLHLLALVVIGLGLFSVYQHIQLVTAESTISNQQSTMINQKLEIDGLASEITFLDGEVSDLAKQAELVAKLNLEHEQKSKAISETGNDWQTKSNELQVSENENTRSWASSALPDDARQLLFDASRSQNSDSQTAGLHSTAIEHGERRLPGTAI
jgi:hypothetical protein